MAATVIEAFEEFQTGHVDLASGVVDLATRSRDWLFDRISEFPDKYDDFPLLYGEMDIAYGSFARKTKIRPLDDIDMISCLHATGASYVAYQYDDVRITVPDSSRLRSYCHDNADLLNSRKVINRYVGALSLVSQYRVAEINRSGEAATLQLATYDWNFDIVPAFFTAPDERGLTYYLIPNGKGHWKKTDPRLDRDRVSRVDRMHDFNMLPILRCAKYWQKRPTMVSMSSYLLESMVVDFFELRPRKASRFADMELADLFRHVENAVLGRVNDPKGIQGDINDLGLGDRFSISQKAAEDAALADQARYLESVGDMKGSIQKWREVFGSSFPEHG